MPRPSSYNNITKGCSCPNCDESKGEALVAQTLRILGIKYTREYAFDECRNDKGNLLFFDFAIFAKNKLSIIEYDGELHFYPVDYFGGKKTFNQIQCYDRIKNQFTKTHNIPLLRIAYYDKGNIKSIVTDWIYLLQS